MRISTFAAAESIAEILVKYDAVAYVESFILAERTASPIRSGQFALTRRRKCAKHYATLEKIVYNMKRHLVVFLSILIFTSCENAISGDFWKDFRSKEIKTENLDHGPYGGTSEIIWELDERNGNFKKPEIVKFAEENNWKFVGEKNNAEIKKTNNLSFRILSDKFNLDDYKNARILIFKTDLLTIREDENSSTQENCFII